MTKGNGPTWKLAIKNAVPLFYVYAGGALDGPWTGSVSTNTWTHLAGVYNGTNVILYKNGVELGRTAKTGLTDTALTAVMIGAENSGGITNPYTGLIDNVRIYNRALSASEILAIYNSGL